MPVTCPRTEILLAIVNGTSLPDESALTAHLSTCERCRRRLEEFAEQTVIPSLLVLDPAHPKADAFSIDSILLERGYKIEHEQSTSNFSTVYRARHLLTGHRVAAKVIHQKLSDPDVRRRLLREAEIAASVDHVNVVRLLDAIELRERLVLILDWMPGGTMARMVDEMQLSFDEIARLMIEVGSGVECLHRSGIIHRDLKPSNILMAADGTPRITDFGIAKRVEGEHTQTSHYAILGTPGYMAPEQSNSFGPSEVQGRETTNQQTDVYGLGAVLYALLTGRSPLQKDRVTSRDICTCRIVSPKVLRRDVPKSLETICLKCLATRQSDRYSTAKELVDDLWRYRRHEPIRAKRISRTELVVRWCQYRMRLLGIVTAISGVLAFASWIVLQSVAERVRLEQIHRCDAALAAIAACNTLQLESTFARADSFPIDEVMPLILTRLEESEIGDAGKLRLAVFVSRLDLLHLERLNSVLEQVSNAEVYQLTNRLRENERRSEHDSNRSYTDLTAGLTTPRARFVALGMLAASSPHEFRQYCPAKVIVEEFVKIASEDAELMNGLFGASDLHLSVNELPPTMVQELSSRQASVLALIAAKSEFFDPELFCQLADMMSIPDLTASLAQVPEHRLSAVRQVFSQSLQSMRVRHERNLLAPSDSAPDTAAQVPTVATTGTVLLPAVPRKEWSRLELHWKSQGYQPVQVELWKSGQEEFITALWKKYPREITVEFDVPITELSRRLLTEANHTLGACLYESSSTEDDLKALAVVLSDTHGNAAQLRLSEASRGDFAPGVLAPEIAAEASNAIDAGQSIRYYRFGSSVVSVKVPELGVVQAAGDIAVSPLPEFHYTDLTRNPGMIASYVPLRCEDGVLRACADFHSVTDVMEAARELAQRGFEIDVVYCLSTNGQDPVFVVRWKQAVPLLTENESQTMARFAFALWLLNDRRPLLNSLLDTTDPLLRNACIDLLAESRIPLSDVLAENRKSGDASIAYGIIIAAGFRHLYVRPDKNEVLRLLSNLQDSANQDLPNVRCLTGWLRQQIGEPELQTVSPLPRIDQCSSHGQVGLAPEGIEMIVVDQTTHQLNGVAERSNRWTLPQPQVVRLLHTFALSTHEITNQQFATFARESNLPLHISRQLGSPEDAAPVVGVNFWEALRFCRWLSDKEGISEEDNCLPPIGEIGPGMKFRADYQYLDGYRLATSFEWETACRAGTLTDHYLGGGLTRLNRHALTALNSGEYPLPVGSYPPNPWGFSEMLGSVYDMTYPYDAELFAGDRVGNKEDPLVVSGRGGSLLAHPRFANAGEISQIRNGSHDWNFGLRIARFLKKH
ncbi:MAG: bifunctional serine/threonine-protein kinase/formylglycine-generating enzyme family protein [Planctomycetaceae bacterium]